MNNLCFVNVLTNFFVESLDEAKRFKMSTSNDLEIVLTNNNPKTYHNCNVYDASPAQSGDFWHMIVVSVLLLSKQLCIQLNISDQFILRSIMKGDSRNRRFWKRSSNWFQTLNSFQYHIQ